MGTLRYRKRVSYIHTYTEALNKNYDIKLGFILRHETARAK